MRYVNELCKKYFGLVSIKKVCPMLRKILFATILKKIFRVFIQIECLAPATPKKLVASQVLVIKKHYRVHHGKNEFVRDKAHIHGVKSSGAKT